MEVLEEVEAGAAVGEDLATEEDGEVEEAVEEDLVIEEDGEDLAGEAVVVAEEEEVSHNGCHVT